MKNIILKRWMVIFTVILLLNTVSSAIYSYAVEDNAKGIIDDKQITIVHDESGGLKYTYKVLKDVELRGINGESKWFFNVDKELQVRDFKLNLYCTLSPMIIKDTSYITIYINNLPVQSISLKDEENNLAMNWVVNIPADKVNTGYNELTVKTHTKTSYDPCEDDEHIVNWIIIDGNTNYVVTYDKKSIYNGITDFARPFAGVYPDNSPGIGVVIPDSYSNEELSAALTMIAHMKAYQLGYQVKTTLVTAGDQQIDAFDSLVYIGSFAGMPESFKILLENNSNDDMNNANIYRAVTMNSGKPLLIIASDNSRSLINAVKALSNDQLKEQMIFNKYLLSPDIDTKIKETKIGDYIYLKNLGLNGIKVEGIKKQVVTIGVRIPFNEVLANESSIDLNIRYSDNLDYEKSMVSLYINGIPIASEKLDKEKKDFHTVKMFIPKEARSFSYYDLRVEFDLIPSGEIT
ncbi:cellulose synthase regulator protein [Oxobacter pfennigii]|uniref:Cellulose synthase regulator protein n=1 Tax=Oxobacter pfennigii TaxID=36849 RepID=A0A0P8WRN1_9CLOT|nr:cellulose synthase regulator protein [Oxobacter pfennigii]